MSEIPEMPLDFYMKGLSIYVRQRLFDYLTRGISETMMKWFREKPEGYPSLRKCGFSDEELQLIFEAYVPKFEHANLIMEENGRPPLFSDPHDAYQSAVEYATLLKILTPEEEIETFGCRYKDYVPVELPKDDAVE